MGRERAREGGAHNDQREGWEMSETEREIHRNGGIHKREEVQCTRLVVVVGRGGARLYPRGGSSRNVRVRRFSAETLSYFQLNYGGPGGRLIFALSFLWQECERNMVVRSGTVCNLSSTSTRKILCKFIMVPEFQVKEGVKGCNVQGAHDCLCVLLDCLNNLQCNRILLCAILYSLCCVKYFPWLKRRQDFRKYYLTHTYLKGYILGIGYCLQLLKVLSSSFFDQ